MSKPDSVLKSRDITLPTKVCIVKAMILKVVRYRCESWTKKKAESRRTDIFKLWCCRRLLSPLDSEEMKPVNPYQVIRYSHLLKNIPVCCDPHNQWRKGKVYPPEYRVPKSSKER